MRAWRIVAVAGALVVCAWFALGVRQAHEIAAATRVAATPGRGQPSTLARAASELRAAAFLNPDQTVDILRARLLIRGGRLHAASRILAAVTRREPQNLEAWIWFTGTNLGNPSAERLGAARIAELDPLDAKVVGR